MYLGMWSNTRLDFHQNYLFIIYSSSLTAKQQLVLQNFLESEENYVGALNVVLHYSKAITAALNSSQPVLTKDEISCIFHHVPQLHGKHSEFLQQLKHSSVAEWNLIQVQQYNFQYLIR